jgi:hypothetical protein
MLPDLKLDLFGRFHLEGLINTWGFKYSFSKFEDLIETEAERKLNANHVLWCITSRFSGGKGRKIMRQKLRRPYLKNKIQTKGDPISKTKYKQKG